MLLPCLKRCSNGFIIPIRFSPSLAFLKSFGVITLSLPSTSFIFNTNFVSVYKKSVNVLRSLFSFFFSILFSCMDTFCSYKKSNSFLTVLYNLRRASFFLPSLTVYIFSFKVSNFISITVSSDSLWFLFFLRSSNLEYTSSKSLLINTRFSALFPALSSIVFFSKGGNLPITRSCFMFISLFLFSAKTKSSDLILFHSV